MKKLIFDENSKTLIAAEFDKRVVNDRYEILFNSKTGLEVMRGINGNPDPSVLDYPSMIDVGIMGHCNNNCPFCYQGDNQQPNMTLDNFKSIVDQSRLYVNQLALGGRGNPNNHEDFEEIVKYARENGIVPNYTTSGIDLTDRQIEISKEYCGAVAVSYYGEEYTFNALKRLIDAGVKTNIHLIFNYASAVLASELVSGIDAFAGRVDLERLNAIIFLLFKPQGRGKNLKMFKPTNFQLKAFGEIIKKPKCKFKVGLDSCLVNKISKIRELTKSEELMADTCEGARMSCYISPDMKFIPCSFGNQEVYGIPIKNTPIQEVWNNGKSFIDFRESLKKENNKCPYEKDCWL